MLHLGKDMFSPSCSSRGNAAPGCGTGTPASCLDSRVVHWVGREIQSCHVVFKGSS